MTGVSNKAGAVAMMATTGAPPHRKAGNLFTVSMLVMTGSAAIVSFFLRTDQVTGVVAVVTDYPDIVGAADDGVLAGAHFVTTQTVAALTQGLQLAQACIAGVRLSTTALPSTKRPHRRPLAG